MGTYTTEQLAAMILNADPEPEGISVEARHRINTAINGKQLGVIFKSTTVSDFENVDTARELWSKLDPDTLKGDKK